MQLAEKALRLDPEHEGALSLWLASNFSRELQTPEGYENPVYPAERRTPLYYAVMAGSGPTQRVLARALDTKSTALARKSIEALSLVAGDAGLWSGVPGRRPLLEALSYPDRRVQYDAALALGSAKPTTPFPGAERVVPLLAGAVRDAGSRFALVIAGDIERQQTLRALVEEQGFKTLQSVSALGDASAALAEASGVDLVVIDLSTDATLRTIEELRAGAKTAASPVLALLSADGLNQNMSRFEGDALTGLSRAGSTDEQLAARIDELSRNASGAPVTEEEAGRYAMSALDTLRDLAINRNEVFNVGDAALPLIAALSSSEGEVRMKVADVLSRVDQSRAQVALMDSALEGEGVERVVLLGKVAESARAFGNLLEDRQVRELSKMAVGEGAEESTAAAALVGALNLQRTDLAPLILGETGDKAARK
jgi:DNA-binding response OmpR family regulator